MKHPSNAFLQFNYVPYPLWRRQMPGWLKAITRPIINRTLAAEADLTPPETPEAMIAFLSRWGLVDKNAAVNKLRDTFPNIEMVKDVVAQSDESISPSLSQWRGGRGVRFDPAPYAGNGTIRLPAQWEQLETVLLTWPSLYPPLWEGHAQMAEAIAPVARVTICVRSALWANAARLFLEQRRKIPIDQIRFLVLPTDDIWVRDYGPIVGLDANGEQVCIKAIFDPLPNYPQEQDNAMALRWAAHEEIPVRKLDLHIEGGNIWSDGAGTLIVSEQVYFSNPGLTYDTLVEKMRAVFDFQKLIVTPRLEREETGHVDLLVKLADAQTVLISQANVLLNSGKLRAAIALFRQSTNAAGQPYRVFELPTPPLYLNWGLWPVWRSYTNALTVNGRVLVPAFGVETDAKALAVYREALPAFEIIPVDCGIGANGGGAVHCLTKEIPAAH